jgi:WD40 repeat protein
VARLSSDGKRMFAAGLERSTSPSQPDVSVLVEINPTTTEVVARIEHLPGRVHSILLQKDGRSVLASTASGSIVQCDLAEKRITGLIRTRFPVLHSLALSPDESQLAAVSGAGKIHLWPLDKGQLGWGVPDPLIEVDHGDGIRGMHFTDGGRQLVVESLWGGISVWDASAGFRSARSLLVPAAPAIAMHAAAARR